MRTLGIVLALLVAATLASQASAIQRESAYVAGGTAVVRSDGEALADNGALVCSTSMGVGVGGGCIRWAAAAGLTSVLVTDRAAGDVVAYQVCIDNNGDSICGGIQDPRCPDQQFFSHADGGAFFNPLGPLPTAFLPGCAGGFPGWVVFLCTGAHEDSSGSHSHAATTGSVLAWPKGTGYGNFCGANGEGTAAEPTVAKAYVVR